MHGFAGTSGVADDLGTRSALAQWLAAVLAGDSAAVLPAPTLQTWPAPLSAAMQRAIDAPRNPARIEPERVRLFVNAPGGIPAPAYGSWWMEGRMQGDSSAEVAECYRREGLRVERGSGAADYVPAELEFVHFLLQHQRAACLTGEGKLQEQAARRERDFLDRYMLPWLDPFRSAVRSATTDPFWLALVDLIGVFVSDESRRVADEGTGN